MSKQYFLLVLKVIVTLLPTYILSFPLPHFIAVAKVSGNLTYHLCFFNSQISPACDVISTRYHVPSQKLGDVENSCTRPKSKVNRVLVLSIFNSYLYTNVKAGIRNILLTETKHSIFIPRDTSEHIVKAKYDKRLSRRCCTGVTFLVMKVDIDNITSIS